MVRPHCHWERGGRQRALIPLLLLSWWLQATTAISYHDYIHDILLWLMGTGYHILLWLQQLLTLELTTPLLATTATMMKQSPCAQGHHGDYSRSRILFLLPPPPALEPTTTTAISSSHLTSELLICCLLSHHPHIRAIAVTTAILVDMSLLPQSFHYHLMSPTSACHSYCCSLLNHCYWWEMRMSAGESLWDPIATENARYVEPIDHTSH